MGTIAKRIKQLAIFKDVSLKELANSIDVNDVTFRSSLNRGSGILEKYLDDICRIYGVSKMWLLTGEGNMMTNETEEKVSEPAVERNTTTEDIVVNEPHTLYTYENSFGNRFLTLPNDQYLMMMPLAEYEVQAGFLDRYQDVEVVKAMSQHSIIVPKTAQGRYVAYRVFGDSMDNGTSEAIQHNNIVATRELKQDLWQYKLKFNEFPYWVIFTKQASTPLLKQIIDHDTERGVITCHSLNDAPNYTDFELSMNDIQALFYVVNVSKEYGDKEY